MEMAKAKRADPILISSLSSEFGARKILFLGDTRQNPVFFTHVVAESPILYKFHRGRVGGWTGIGLIRPARTVPAASKRSSSSGPGENLILQNHPAQHK